MIRIRVRPAKEPQSEDYNEKRITIVPDCGPNEGRELEIRSLMRGLVATAEAETIRRALVAIGRDATVEHSAL